MKHFVVRFTEDVNGKEAWHRQIVFARDLEDACDRWANMRLTHQQTEDISIATDFDL